MNRSNLMKAVLCVGLGAFVLGRPAPAEAATTSFDACFIDFGTNAFECDQHACGDCDGTPACAHFENGTHNVWRCVPNDS